MLAFLFVALIVIFGFISAFVPWAMKDLDVGVRAWAFPFKTCLRKTFSEINEETCMDNDWMVGAKGVPLTGGNAACKAYMLTVIAFVFLSVLVGALSLILMFIMLEFIWKRPVVAARILVALLILVSIFSFLTWIFFVIYMQTTCAPGSIFPISPGYTYGFILYLFNSIFSIIAVGFGIRARRIIHSKMTMLDVTKDSEQDEESNGTIIPPYTDAVTPVYPIYEMHSPNPTPVSNAQSASFY
jgi:hypothetical protein